MNTINNLLNLIDSYIGGSSWFVALLLGTGLFYTIYLRFPQFRFFGHAINVIRGKYDKPGDKGDTSHFQSLATALSGTVGTGNIAGVAFALYLGGPAGLFWMIICAFLGMTTKFVEVILSHKYREIEEDGSISGGPMYYMKKRLKTPHLAGFFALMVIFSAFGLGSFPQINSISNSLFATYGLSKILTGAILAIILAFVILGGIKRIASVTEKLVPFMALVYFVASIIVICCNYENIIPSIISIFSDVFSGTAATGGFLGATFSFAFNKGVNRGLFSNEAGLGSAPIAHAAARTSEPVAEGVVSLLEPFIDTIVICTLTGLVILSSGVWKEKLDNTFQAADMVVFNQKYHENIAQDKKELSAYVMHKKKLPLYDGNLNVVDGIIQEKISILHAHSLAENVKVFDEDDKLYTGKVLIEEGVFLNEEDVSFKGRSLIHSAPLTAEAFSRSILGDFGKTIVSFGLLLFAFSTSLAWAYYGGRSVNFLLGNKWVLPFRLIFCISYFFAAFVDTTIAWTLSAITIALMALPNLLGLLILHKEVKTEINDYKKRIKKDFSK
ncbi:MAG: sodium:alanine symporter family protein [Marinifilaceae bacterium]|jgi:AGCS family alanine or glycine:cation symporter|nr:sodium:alanine symporter family protein [Marinifilaceae bacterium]